MVECFSTSVEKYNLQYTEYLADGDSKSYKEVCEADPYGKPITKLEYRSHSKTSRSEIAKLER